MHRRDLANNAQVPAAQRQVLVQLIQQFLATTNAISRHASTPPTVHNDGALFLSWHRGELGVLESWLTAQPNGAQFVPLPGWDPATNIPAEFQLQIQNAQAAAINVSFSPQFDPPRLGDYETDDDLGMALMGPHNLVHGRVGGDMGFITTAAAAPIFWPWHAFLDDIWWDWQRVTVLTPNCVGLSEAQARTLITGVGLQVGTVTTLPHVDFPVRVDDIPFPWPPAPWSSPGGWPPPPWPRLPRPPRLHRHTVSDQTPEAGDRVVRGTRVNLILGI